MISRKEGADKVLEIALSKAAYEERDKQQRQVSYSADGLARRADDWFLQVFEERVMSRAPGEVQSQHAGYEDLVLEESSKKHFTYCVIEVCSSELVLYVPSLPTLVFEADN